MSYNKHNQTSLSVEVCYTNGDEDNFYHVENPIEEIEKMLRNDDFFVIKDEEATNIIHSAEVRKLRWYIEE